MKEFSHVKPVYLFLSLLLFTDTFRPAETVKQREQREAFQKQLEIGFSEVSQKLKGLSAGQRRSRRNPKEN